MAGWRALPGFSPFCAFYKEMVRRSESGTGLECKDTVTGGSAFSKAAAAPAGAKGDAALSTGALCNTALEPAHVWLRKGWSAEHSAHELGGVQ